MDCKLTKSALDQIFLEARTHRDWLDKAVDDEILQKIYELLRMAPTSANCSPGRVVFVKSAGAKEKLIPCMSESNREKTRKAPVTAVIAMDLEFYAQLPKLYPQADARSWFVGNIELIQQTAFRNSSLQGAYLIIAARSLGLDCGPMSGFDNAQVDAAFFQGTAWRSNFVCNLGYGDGSKLFPRGPRLDFHEACKIV